MLTIFGFPILLSDSSMELILVIVGKGNRDQVCEPTYACQILADQLFDDKDFLQKVHLHPNLWHLFL